MSIPVKLNDKCKALLQAKMNQVILNDPGIKEMVLTFKTALVIPDQWGFDLGTCEFVPPPAPVPAPEAEKKE